MIETLAWHKDQWSDIDRIFIAANNRGLKFADGIFETILIKENKPVLFDEHLKRLEKSSKILNINLKINKLTLRQLIHDGIRKLSLKNDQFASVRINYSRGTNEGRTLKIDCTLETKDLDNLWLEFYRIKPSFNPISVFISQTEKINEFSLISKCKTFSYNQAIQVLQGPYITNTYGGGIQCQGPTMNVTPFLTGNIAVKRPYEDYWMDPVYNNVDANNDDVPDNPGEILYYKPVRTGQKDSSTISLGISATWSKPLDKKLQEQCKQAASANIALMNQSVANKRLDFEIARLKNCGELMKAGIMFHRNSPYFAVCADVVLVNPPGTLPNHSHSITPNPLPSGDASVLKEISIGNP